MSSSQANLLLAICTIPTSSAPMRPTNANQKARRLNNPPESASMSQDYFGEPGSSKQKQPADSNTSGSPQRAQWQRPSYMTVGSGSTSESADRLQDMLEKDSGYGSMADGASFSADQWGSNILPDTPSSSMSPLHPGASPPQCEYPLRIPGNCHLTFY